MAFPNDFVRVGDLLNESAGDEKENEVLERLKLLAQEHLPDGWTEWKVSQLSKEQLLGDPMDPLILNKIRFALPTIGVVKAFLPDASHLSEKTYRDIKVSMLEWPFCRALIISPPVVANKIRGSAAQTEIFNQAIKSLKPLLMSRQEVSDQLGESVSEFDSEEDTSDSHRKRRRQSLKGRAVKKAKMDRVSSLENRMESMFATVCARLDALTRNTLSAGESSAGEEDESVDNISDVESSQTWQAPELDIVDPPDLNFLPEVREADPTVPEPTPVIKSEGITCQRFGLESWNKIRYKDVQKRLQAAPVFGALKVNSQLGSLAVKSFASNLLFKLDDTRHDLPWSSQSEESFG